MDKIDTFEKKVNSKIHMIEMKKEVNFEYSGKKNQILIFMGVNFCMSL